MMNDGKSHLNLRRVKLPMAPINSSRFTYSLISRLFHASQQPSRRCEYWHFSRLFSDTYLRLLHAAAVAVRMECWAIRPPARTSSYSEAVEGDKAFCRSSPSDPLIFSRASAERCSGNLIKLIKPNGGGCKRTIIWSSPSSRKLISMEPCSSPAEIPVHAPM
jgi:hypothetical protein